MKMIKPATIVASGVVVAALVSGSARAAIIVAEAESAALDTNVWKVFTPAQLAAGGQNDGGNPVSYNGTGLSGNAVQHIADQNGDAGPGDGNMQLSFNIPSADTYYLYTRLIVPTDSGIRSSPTAEATSGSHTTSVNNDSFYLPVLADVPISGTGGSPTNGRNTGAWGSDSPDFGIPGVPDDEPVWVIAVHQDDVVTPVGAGVFKSRMSGGTLPQTYSLTAGLHTLSVRGREVGLIVDTFVLSDASDLTSLQLDAAIGIPEPATLSLAALCLAGLVSVRRRR